MTLETQSGISILFLLIFIVLGGALLNKINNISGFYRFLIGLILLNLVLSTITPEWSLFNILTLEHINFPNQDTKDLWSIRGQIGDIMSGHFSALAFIALLITIDQMKQSIEKQNHALQMQENYFKKQEFERHFFKLHDEFINAKKTIDRDDVFKEYTKKIHDEHIVEIDNFKSEIYEHQEYPKNFFNLLKFIINYIVDNQVEKSQYELLIKSHLLNMDLFYLALYDAVNGNKMSVLLEQLDIFENLNEDDDEVFDLIILLKDYLPLETKLKNI